METETKEETFTLAEILAVLKPTNQLILWNDNINTFDHVIECLVKHLQYSAEQAENIAWAVHTRGKYVVLEGPRNELEVFRKILKAEGLTVTIE